MGNSFLVTVEGPSHGAHTVCLYEIQNDQLKLLDRNLDREDACFPRADVHRNIYLPYKSGIGVVRIVDSKEKHLHQDRTLTGGGTLKNSYGVCAVDDATLCVTVLKGDSNGVYLLDTITDTVLAVLDPPAGLEGATPGGVASLSGSVLVGYCNRKSLALYAAGMTSGTLLQPEGLVSVWGVTSDPGGRFLVADWEGNTIWVLSGTGEVVVKGKAKRPYDVTLSSDQTRLFVGNHNSGQITVLQIPSAACGKL